MEGEGEGQTVTEGENDQEAVRSVRSTSVSLFAMQGCGGWGLRIPWPCREASGASAVFSSVPPKGLSFSLWGKLGRDVMVVPGLQEGHCHSCSRCLCGLGLLPVSSVGHLCSHACASLPRPCSSRVRVACPWCGLTRPSSRDVC